VEPVLPTAKPRTSVLQVSPQAPALLRFAGGQEHRNKIFPGPSALAINDVTVIYLGVLFSRSRSSNPF
jgi:hypothetical protein